MPRGCIFLAHLSFQVQKAVEERAKEIARWEAQTDDSGNSEKPRKVSLV